MNDKIDDLWEQCKTPPWSNATPIYDHRLFAELIVKECATLIDAEEIQSRYGNLIKKHFGVEQ